MGQIPKGPLSEEDAEWYYPDGGWHLEDEVCEQIGCDGPHMEIS